MELQQLKYFMIVAETGHLTRAAESLFISQPALSRSIRRLETELGLKLFEKRGRGIALTEYGEHFFAHVKHIYEELEQAEAERNDLLDRTGNPIRLGTTIPGITLPIMETYRTTHPNAAFFHEALSDSKKLLGRISDGKLDLGFCDATRFPANIQHRKIWEDQFYAVFPKRHPLSSAESVRFDDLLTQTLILSNSEASLLELIASFYPQAPSEHFMYAANMPEALRLGQMGCGVTVTSGLFLEIQIQESTHNGKSLLDFANPVPIAGCTWEIYLAWKDQNYIRTSLAEFLEYAITYYQTISEQTILQSIIRRETR